jgi:hypothetical protein
VPSSTNRVQYLEIELEDNGALKTLQSVDQATASIGATAQAASRGIDALEQAITRSNAVQAVAAQSLTAMAKAMAEQTAAQQATAFSTNAYLQTLDATRREITDLSQATEQQVQSIRAASDAVKDAAVAQETFQTEVVSATKSAGVMGGVIGGLVGGLSTQLLPMLMRTATAAIDFADDTQRMAQTLDISAESAQRFSFAAEQAGATAGDVRLAIEFMNNALADGSKGTIASLDRAGLSLDHLRAEKPDTVFLEIADAIRTIPDPMRQAQVTMDLFGRSGQNLLPAIRNDIKAVGDQTIVMSDQTVARLAESKSAWSALGQQITVATGTLLVWLQKSNPYDFGTSLANAYGRAIRQATNTQTVPTPDLANPLAALTTGGAHAIEVTDQLADAADKAAASAQASVKAWEDYTAKIQALADTISGITEKKDMEALAAAITKAGGASQISGAQFGEVQDKIEQFREDGLKLPPVLQAIASEIDRVNSLLSALDDTAKDNQSIKALIDQFDALVGGTMPSGRSSLGDQFDAIGKAYRSAMDQLKSLRDQNARDEATSLNEIVALNQRAYDAQIEAWEPLRDYVPDLYADLVAVAKRHLDDLNAKAKETAEQSSDEFDRMARQIERGIDEIANAFSGDAKIVVSALGDMLESAVAFAKGDWVNGTISAVKTITGLFRDTLDPQIKAYEAQFDATIYDNISGAQALERELKRIGREDLWDALEGRGNVLMGGAKKASDALAEIPVALADAAKAQDAAGAAAQGYGQRISAYADNLLDHVKAYDDLTDQAKDKADELNQAIADGDADRVASILNEATQIQQQMDDAAADINGLAEQAQGSFDRMGRMGQATFGAVLETTGSIYQAWQAVEEPVGKLIELQDRLGLEATGAAADFLSMARVMSDNSDILEALDADTQMVKGLGDAHLLTAQTAADFGEDIAAQYDTLTQRGLSSQQALAMVAPTLQTLWEYAQDYGVQLDANTQSLIDQAQAQGLVGEEAKSTNDQILDVLKSIADVFGADYSDKGVEAQNQVKTATEGMNTELEQTPAKLAAVDWTSFANAGVNALETVRDSAAHLVLGRSPGLVHIPQELIHAIQTAKDFQDQGSGAMDAVRETVADLTDEQKKAIDAMLEQHKAISRIADAMGLATDLVQDYADAWNDAKRAAEEAAQAREAAQREAETKADFIQGIERDIAKASTTDDLASKLLDLAFQKQDDLQRAVEVFGVDSPYNKELQQAKTLISEKYDLLEQQARQDVANAAQQNSSSGGSTALQDEIETLLQYSSAGDYLTPILDKIRQKGALLGASAAGSLATLQSGAGGLTISIGGVSIALGDGTSEADLSAEIGNAIVGSLKQQGVRLAAG